MSTAQQASRRLCWWKTADNSTVWNRGLFHQWSTDCDEYESGPGHFPVAIIEDAAGQVHSVYVKRVHFGKDPMDPSVEGGTP